MGPGPNDADIPVDAGGDRCGNSDDEYERDGWRIGFAVEMNGVGVANYGNASSEDESSAESDAVSELGADSRYIGYEAIPNGPDSAVHESECWTTFNIPPSIQRQFEQAFSDSSNVHMKDSDFAIEHHPQPIDLDEGAKMVKFVVESCTAIGRLGRISSWGDVQIEHRTPSCMVYTRAGHIPHLTWDVATNWLHLIQQPIFQLTLPSLVHVYHWPIHCSEFLAYFSFESLSVIEKFGKGVAAFCAMPKSAATHLSVLDPLAQIESGFNDSRSVSIWTKAGRRGIDVKTLRRILSSCRPCTIETLLDYDTPRDCANKRLTKSITRTIHFFKEAFEFGPPLEVPTLVSLGGGFSAFHRERCAVELGQSQHAAAFAIDLMQFAKRPSKIHTRAARKAAKRKATSADRLKESQERSSPEDNGSASLRNGDQKLQDGSEGTQSEIFEQQEARKATAEARDERNVEDSIVKTEPSSSDEVARFDEIEIEQLLSLVFPRIPSTSLRYTSGAFSPSEVVVLTRIGIDLFDSSYAVMLAEQGQAFRLSDQFPADPTFSVADFNDKKFADDFSRPYEDCECYTCSHYTKGYLQHLRNTDEMLGPILLVM
ncbi:unnamed protein product [Toxocara canis]|uniref:CxC2 domain-containing protein n=1 Tax=Toxocara canis TaxID=6265 RepID=A0A183V252_TOXCA|nr:unnamed protein product [Toxocara canis]